MSLNAIRNLSIKFILSKGNNSLCEAIYFGVPVLITPIIGDQINNAVRVKETGFGDSFDVMNFTETELERKIERLLNDDQLQRKLKDTSKRIQKDLKIYKVVDCIANWILKEDQ